jgi:hypothetical protein
VIFFRKKLTKNQARRTYFVNYTKIDATLAAEIARIEQEGGSEKLSIFIVINGKTFTGNFSFQTIEELSEHSWVTRIAGSRRAFPKVCGK